MTLLWACLAALLGVGLGLAGSARPEVLAVTAVAAIGGAIAFQRAGGSRASRFLLLGAFVVLGAARGSAAASSLQRANPYNDSGPHDLLCVVTSDPRREGLWQSYTCAVQSVDGAPSPAWSAAVSARPLSVLRYGDKVRLRGEPTTPPAEEGSNYRDHLARRGVTSLLKADQADLVATGPRSVRRTLFGVRRRAVEGLLVAVPEPEASFLSGVVLGTAEGMPEPVEEDLRRSGLLHILVVSGANVSFLAAALVGLLRRPFGWGAALGGAVMLCLGYSLLTGADPPVIRGSVMVLLAVGAQAAGRPGHGWTALTLAATAIALANPVLLLEPSYQLSVATSAGMLWAQRWDWRPGSRLRWLGLVASALTTTLAAQVTSLPISAVHFGRLPGLGLLSNALVLPLQPIQMLAALAATVAAMVAPGVAAWVAVPAWGLARFTLSVAHLAARLPLATFEAASWSAVAVVTYYAVLVAVVSGRWRNLGRWLDALRAWRPPKHLPVWGIAVVATLAVWTVALQLPDGRLHVAFLDVGQGDAILITSPSGRTVLVDGGPDPDVLRGHLGRALPLWGRHLDVVVLTHPDMDHMGGLLGLAPRHSVGILLSPAAAVPETWTAQWQDLAERATEVRMAAAGQVVDLGDGVILRILYPPASGCPTWSTSDNDCSTVLQVSYGDATMLLTGDAERIVEGLLISQGELRPSWLLKVSHHGSARATRDELLDMLGPRLAVISVGENRYGHPSPEVLERLHARGIQCLRTDQLGTVEIETDGQQYTVRAHG